jgi:FtsP/CotA-like multicopper oxidase with cupredoxin domain
VARADFPARRNRRRTLIAVVVALVVLAPLGWLWQASLLPDSYSVMDMGYPDHGGGPHHSMAGMPMAGRSVASLTEVRSGPADLDVTLTARKEQVRLASGRVVDGYTLYGTSPGPVIRAEQGQLIQVRLVNESVPDGVTLHWHGIDVPNAADGIAGVTQDAVPVGG